MQTNSQVVVDKYSPTILKVFLAEVGLETVGVNQTRFFLKPEKQAEPEVAALMSTDKNIFITGILVTVEQHMRDTLTSQTWTAEVACGQQYIEHVHNVTILNHLVNNVKPDEYWECLATCRNSLEIECTKLGIYESWVNTIRYDKDANQIYCEIPMAEKFRELYVKKVEEETHANSGLNIQDSRDTAGSSSTESYRAFFSSEPRVYKPSYS
jgi:hypothetical protein